jgi:hypothetical protein
MNGTWAGTTGLSSSGKIVQVYNPVISRETIADLPFRFSAAGVHYRSLYPMTSKEAYEADVSNDTTLSMLRRYFALDDGASLVELYADWSKRDANFTKKTSDGRFAGIRVLKQDSWEALIAYVFIVHPLD